MITTVLYGKIGITVNRERGHYEISDVGKRRGAPPEAVHEFGDPGALDIDEHALSRIRDVSFEFESSGEVVDVGPETDALHNAFDYDLSPFSH